MQEAPLSCTRRKHKKEKKGMKQKKIISICRTVRSRPSGPRTVDLNQQQLTKQITCLIEKNQEQSKSNLPVAIKVYGTSLLQEQSAIHCWVFRNISQLISFHHSLKTLRAPKPQTHRQLDRTGQKKCDSNFLFHKTYYAQIHYFSLPKYLLYCVTAG